VSRYNYVNANEMLILGHGFKQHWSYKNETKKYFAGNFF